MYDRKFVLCTGQAVTVDLLPHHPGAHIIGEIHYMPEEGIHVSAMAVYERSRSVTDVPESMPSVRLDIIGDARNIRCTCCYRKKKRWEMSKTAITLMMSRFKLPVRTV